MNIEQEKISSLQLMALIFFSVSGAVGIFYPGSIVGNNMWLAYLAGFLAALLLVWIVLKLYNYYPGKNLIEINEYIY
jgi:hypothetical protein